VSVTFYNCGISGNTTADDLMVVGKGILLNINKIQDDNDQAATI